MKKSMKTLKSHAFPLLLFVLLTVISVWIAPKDNGQYVQWRMCDSTFHFSRMLSLDDALVAPTDFRYFSHMGAPINIMYPWLFLLPWRLLYALVGHQLYLSYYLYSGLIILTSLIITYYVVYRLQRKQGLAMTVAVIYTFAFYHMWDVYYRFSVGENLSFMVMPLLLLALHQIFFEKTPRWRTLAVVMTLTAYMHYLSLVMYSLVIATVLVIVILRHECQWSQLLALTKAALWTIALSVASLVPMMIYGHINQLDLPHKGDVASRALNGDHFFEHAFRMSYGINAETCGWLILVLGVISLIYFVKANDFDKSIIWVGWLSMVMTTTILNWHELQTTFLGLMQFPWRFFSVTTLCFSYVGVKAVFYYLRSMKKIYPALLLMLLFFGFFVQDTVSYNRRVDDNPLYQRVDDKMLSEMIHNKIPWQGSGSLDYAPKKSMPQWRMFAGHYMRMDYHYYHLNVDTTAQTWKTSFQSPVEQKAILPVFANKDYQVEVNGRAVPLESGYNGGIQIPVQAGKNEVTVTAKNPPYIYLSWLFSGVMLCIFIYTSNKQQRQKTIVKEE